MSGKKRETTVYTDGSCHNNGKKNAYAGYGVFFGDNDPRNIAAPFFIYPLTNNRAELCACIFAIRQYTIYRKMRAEQSILTICSDSQYVIKALTEWLPGWKKRGWKRSNGKPVENMDMIYWLDKEIQLVKGEIKIEFRHVRAHGRGEESEVNRYGNEMADQLANQGAELGLSADQ